MKKILSVFLICLMSVSLLAGCGKRTDAVKAVESQIKAIGEVSLDSADAIDAAQKAYNALSEDEKKAVHNHKKLAEAAEELKALQTKFGSYDEMNDAIDKILDAAGSSFTANGTDFSGLIEQGEAILEQYKDLDKEGQSYVKVTDELSEAIESLKGSVDRSTESAAEYVKAFNTVYADEKYEVTAVYCLKQVRDDTEYHIFALTYKDAAGQETTLYANARCSANTKASVIVDNADAFFAAKAVSDDYNAKENGNVTLDLAAVLELAK